MTTIGNLMIHIGASTKGLQKGLGDTRKMLEQTFGSGIVGGVAAGVAVANVAMGAVSTVMGAVQAAVGGSVQAARESVAVNKDLEQTIASTGGAAGVTAQAARDLAQSLSMVTNFEDDTILKSEAMLLTFTKIGKDVFPQATEAVLDLGQKFGSIDTAAVQVGKALNDPIKGITALTRVGVTFTEQQKQQIAGFMAVNDIASAQRVILDELATEFGGQARALADPWTQIGNQIGEVQEAIGLGLLPILTSLGQAVLPGLAAAAQWLGEVLPPMGQAIATALGPEFAGVKELLVQFVAALSTAAEGVGELVEALGGSSEGINAVRIALTPLLVIIHASIAFWTLVGDVINFVGNTLKAIAGVIQGVKAGWTALSNAMSEVNSVGGRLMSVWNAITGGLQGVVNWIQRSVSAWQMMITTMSQAISLPPVITPGSPTPLEMGIRGITNAVNQLPSFNDKFAVPGLATAGAGAGPMGSTTNIYIDGVNVATSQGDQESGLEMALDLLRQRIRAKR